MPNWSDVLKEIQAYNALGGLDVIRRKYLLQLHQHTRRNVIAYYSGWLQKPGHWLATITDDDKNGFMNAVHNLDRQAGLDLLLHTPGGDLAATESIVDYLRKMFGTNMRVIIPQLAMSGGTMIACAGREIVMGKQSNIGPIDPQFNGIPAHGVISEFEEALRSVKADPSTLPIWRIVIEKYHPTFIGECRNAILLATEMAVAWLRSGMFEKDPNRDALANQVVNHLNNHADTKTHARHLHADEARAFGLKVVSLETDMEPFFQDTVLTIHHAFMHTFSHSGSIKIVENHLGNAIVYSAGQAKG